MPSAELPAGRTGRLRLIRRALWLVSLSVAFGVLSGIFSLVSGWRNHSLGVVAIGLGVLADVVGSAVLIWRFRAELRNPLSGAPGEQCAAVVVALALAAIFVLLAEQSVAALASGSRPGTSGTTLVAAGIWWQADRIAALVVAAIAAVEAWHTAGPWRLARSGSLRRE